MPRVLADLLSRRLLDAFPPRRAYAPATFEREPMPPPVAHFLKHLLEHRLQQEATHLDASSPWFNAGHADVQRARQAFLEALIQHGRFPAEAWEASLKEAAEQVTAYLARPVATLLDFVFENNEERVATDIIQHRMQCFTGYSYLHEATQLYFQQKELTEIDRSHFARLLRHIDRKVTNDYDAAAWLHLLAPLYDLARRAGHGDGVPVPLLAAFFEDKDAEGFAERLQAYPSDAALDEEDLRRLLEGEELKPTPTEVPAGTGDGVAEAPAASPPEESPKSIPLWKQFQQGAVTSPAGPRRSPPSAPPPADPPRPPSTSGDSVPRWMQFRLPPEPSPTNPAITAQPPSDLEALEQAVLGDVGARNRDLFVRHLFRHSPDAYERTLRRLHAAPSWPDASKIIADEVFRKHQVNIYSDPAVLFTDAVEARFG